MKIHARQAWLPQGWVENLRLEIAGGQIENIVAESAPLPGDTRVDTLLPALSNLHSHGFQRAMAGMTEHRGPTRDSFWSWRDLMYRFSAVLTPEQVEAITALAYIEMMEAGFAAVAEFHYLHHQPGGDAYAAPEEMSRRIFAAARESGIGLTHLPVLYTHGGAGRQPLAPGQARFGCDVARYSTLFEAAARALADGLPDDACIGIAPHSLRATDPDELREALTLAGPDTPIHIHVAEQPREVAEVTDWLGAPPVAWLIDNAAVDARWCLVHATHMTAAETDALAACGATAGLCPVTEANLGDGAFEGARYISAGGHYGIGTDSNVRISLSGELRLLEYSQRLRDGARNVMTTGTGSVGDALYRAAAAGGARALGRPSGEIAPGRLADLVAIDSAAPTLCALGREQLLDGLIFASEGGVVTDVWSAGRHVVSGGRHHARDTVFARYRDAMREVLSHI